jgi:hypothetical protein
MPTESIPPPQAATANSLLSASLAAKADAVRILAEQPSPASSPEFEQMVSEIGIAESKVGRALADLAASCELYTHPDLGTEIRCLNSLNIERSDWYRGYLGTVAYIFAVGGEVNDALRVGNLAAAQESVQKIRMASIDFSQLEVPTGAEPWQTSIVLFMTELSDYLDARVGNAAGTVSTESLGQADQQFKTASEQMDAEESKLFWSDCNSLEL